jgi:hypothetical protein
MNTGHLEILEGERIVHSQDRVYPVNTDPMNTLWTPGERPHARVGFTLGTQHNFGELKVTASVSLECDQNDVAVNTAGMLAFNKALELMNDGIAVMAQGITK